MARGHCHFYKVQPGLWVSIPAECRTRTKRIEDRWPVCTCPESSRIILKKNKSTIYLDDIGIFFILLTLNLMEKVHKKIQAGV